ncbi:integrase arm-type DNA-binding domain-containing protein [Paracoccaceae bacterium]|nr:integrase arm-type DNA-binding domain-containing protein [Paracoccaceae bacterium]
MGEVKSKARKPTKGLTTAKISGRLDVGKYHDGSGIGLFLRVDPDGSKFWVQRITLNGKRPELGLGSFPAVSLAQAREAAWKNKQIIKDGKDPRDHQQTKTIIPTFSEAVDEYLKFKLSEFQNEKHKAQWRSTLENYAFPLIGKKMVNAITVTDILTILQPIWETKTETASRLRGRIENVLSWAKVSGFRKGDNPALWKGNLSELLAKPSKIKVLMHQPAIALPDLSRWWKDLASRDGMGKIALQFMALTAARSGEIRGMVWEEVVFFSDKRAIDHGCTGIWTVPAIRMKMGREHRIPLPSMAIDILKTLEMVKTFKYVFPSSKGLPLSDMTLSALMRRMHQSDLKVGRGYVDARSKRQAVPHGLRSTFRDWASENGYPKVVAELQLAHKVGSDVERAYRRTDMFAQRATMMNAWVGFLTQENEKEPSI